MGLFSRFKTSTAIMRKEEEFLYAAVAKEMDAGIRNEALWLKALEQAGDESRRVSKYIKLRIQSLKDAALIEDSKDVATVPKVEKIVKETNVWRKPRASSPIEEDVDDDFNLQYMSTSSFSMVMDIPEEKIIPLIYNGYYKGLKRDGKWFVDRYEIGKEQPEDG
jgi:hypothetical protein